MIRPVLVRGFEIRLAWGLVAITACRPADPVTQTDAHDPRTPSGTTPDEPERPPVSVTGPLDGDTVWTPDDGPYRVEEDVTVPAGATLTIAAGSTVYFVEGAGLTVAGRLRAEGAEDARITLAMDPTAAWVPDLHPALPEGPPHWNGIRFVESDAPDNLLSYVDIDRAQVEKGAVGVFSSEVVLEHLVVTGTRLRMIYADTSSLLVRDSNFPTMFAPEDRPDDLLLDNLSEVVKGIGGIPEGGHFRIERNVFGLGKGHNDVIDVTSGRWPGPVLEVRDNVFLGSGDEAIDGGGDILIDGNWFQAFVKDLDNHGTGDSNVLSTGDELPTIAVATRNVYVGVDHVANLKNGSFGYFEHNTVVGISEARPSLPGDVPHRILESSAIRFLIPSTENPVSDPPRNPAGFGAYLEANVFVDVPERIFGNPDENGGLEPVVTWLDVVDTLIGSAALFANSDERHGRSFDYLVGDPVFVAPENGDYRLAPGSIGAGAARHGLDLGAGVPAGATVCCVPDTTGATLTFEVGGPGVFSYVWRIDGGAWSTDIPIAEPTDFFEGPTVARTVTSTIGPLGDGPHDLEIRGRDLAGVLQAEPKVLTFTVDAAR